jgi:gliding motility-associated lipoprotein GldH
MKAFKLTLTVLSLLITLISCGPDYVYKEKQEISQEGWAYADSVCFHFDIQDTLTHYNLWLDVDHDASYAYQNIYVQFHTQFPDGKRQDQTLSLELADQNGLWNGECRSNRCSIHIPLQSNAYFNQTGTYSICLEQYMRISPLPGILGFQLAIEPFKEEQ